MQEFPWLILLCLVRTSKSLNTAIWNEETKTVTRPPNNCENIVFIKMFENFILHKIKVVLSPKHSPAEFLYNSRTDSGNSCETTRTKLLTISSLRYCCWEFAKWLRHFFADSFLLFSQSQKNTHEEVCLKKIWNCNNSFSEIYFWINLTTPQFHIQFHVHILDVSNTFFSENRMFSHSCKMVLQFYKI